jgi:hypothetical protein
VSDSIKFGGVTLDCPDAGELAAFYAEITGGEVTVPGDFWAMMTCPDGSDICFQAAPAYARPTWPDPVSSMQMHLDFDADDAARSCGSGCALCQSGHPRPRLRYLRTRVAPRAAIARMTQTAITDPTRSEDACLALTIKTTMPVSPAPTPAPAHIA